MSASLDLVYRTAARLGVKLEEAALVRPDFASGRGYWQAGQSGLNPQRLVFVDGRALTAVDGGATNMVRRYGRGSGAGGWSIACRTCTARPPHSSPL